MAGSGDGMSWYFQLVDKVTGPAKDMSRSLASVNESLKQADQQAGSGGGLQKAGAMIRQLFGAGAEGQFYKGASGLAGMLGKLDKIIPLDALKAAGGALVTAGAGVLSAVGSLVEIGAEVALTAAAAVAALAVVGFKMMMDGAEHRRTMTLGFEAFLGDVDAAKRVMTALGDYADKTAMSKHQVMDFGKQLLGAGFKESELKPLIGALSDIMAANGGDVAKSQELMQQLIRMKSLDKVSTRELFAFGSMGIPADKIFAALAEQRHVTLAQAKQLFDSGAVSANQAMQAVLDTVRTGMGGGKLGGLGLKLDEGSIDAQLTHLHDAWKHIFSGGDIQPIVDFIRRLREALEGGAGEKLQATVTKLFNAVTSLFGAAKGDDMKATLDGIADGFDKVVDFVIKFGAGVVETWDQVKGPLGTIADLLLSMGSSDAMGAGWQVFANNLKMVADTAAGVIEMYSALAALPAQMASVGSDLVNGLWEGLQSGWAQMMEKFHGLVDMLPAAARKILGIQSPSKVFANLGLQTGAGFSVGLDASDLPGQIDAALKPPSIAASANAIGAQVNAAIAPGPSPTLASMAGGAYASNRSAPVIELHIHVDGHGGDEALARQIAEQTERVALPALVNALEQLQMETGG